jgi:MoxR-like ATPase
MTQEIFDPSAVPLVGRSVELRRLVAALDRAAGGRGGTVLLAGEAGVGKSRLAGEAMELAGAGEAEVPGVPVAWKPNSVRTRRRARWRDG